MRDETLERAFARRDPWAYESAYRRTGARLYATARNVVRDDALAADCVHDVFLRLWRRGSVYTPARGSLEAFLVTCVRNEALARVRNDARRSVLARQLLSDEAYREDDDPIERERIARAVASLNPAQARTIELAYFRGFTLSEIASDSGEPLGTIKSRISSALRKLRESLGEGVRDA